MLVAVQRGQNVTIPIVIRVGNSSDEGKDFFLSNFEVDVSTVKSEKGVLSESKLG